MDSSAIEADPRRPNHKFHLPHLGKMHLPHFPFPLHLNSKKLGGEFHRDVPKGCLAVHVGQGEEQHERCVIPVEYINHPLFEKLLKQAEEEYGFEQNGRIAIPCHVSDFQYVREVIHREIHESHAHLSCFG